MSILVLASTVPLGAQWPQFRGPAGNGTAGATPLPLKWGEEQNVRWKTAVHGRAWSSPDIHENRLWITTATEDGHDLFVVALDPATGRILRDTKLFHGQEKMSTDKNRLNSWSPVKRTLEL